MGPLTRANHGILGSLMIIAAPMFDQASSTGDRHVLASVAEALGSASHGVPLLKRMHILSKHVCFYCLELASEVSTSAPLVLLGREQSLVN